MNKAQLLDCICHGREIEFIYEGKRYSITYSPEGAEDYISFCEYCQEPTDVKTADELMAVMCNGMSVLQMLESLSEENIWIL